MGNDPFDIAWLVVMGALGLLMVVSFVWPFARVPEGQFGVEATGGKRSIGIVPQGQRGVQPRLLPAGARYFRWRRRVTFHDMVVVPDGQVGVVTSYVGASVGTDPSTHSRNFTDVEAFLADGGRQGVQASLLMPGVYAIHPNAFEVTLYDQVVIPEDSLGVITSHIGVDPTEDAVPYDHRFGDFTDIQAFLEAGGRQGVQEPVLMPGTYAIHPNAFEVIVVGPDSDDDESHVVYGDTSEATDLLTEHGFCSVQTDRGTAISVEVGSRSLAMQAVGQGSTDLSVERILLLVIRPTRDMAIEWEIAVGLGLIDPEKTVVEILNSLAQEAFGPGTRWSVVEFVSRLLQMQHQVQGLYRSRINEAVMLPTSTVWAKN